VFTGDDPDEISSSGSEDNADIQSSDVEFKGMQPSLIFIVINTHTFNGPLSGTIRVSRYQKDKKTIWILQKQETVSGSGISWAICKSAPRSRQISTPALHRSVFYRPDVLPAAQPTASKH